MGWQWCRVPYAGVMALFIFQLTHHQQQEINLRHHDTCYRCYGRPSRSYNIDEEH